MGASPRPVDVHAPPLASTQELRTDVPPSAPPLPGQEAAEDVVKLHPGCSLDAGQDDWALATLSLPGSSRVAILKKKTKVVFFTADLPHAVSRGRSEVLAVPSWRPAEREIHVEVPSFPDEVMRLRAWFSVDISSMGAASALCLLRFGIPEAYQAALAEARSAAGIETQGDRAALPNLDLMKQGIVEAVQSAGGFFLTYWRDHLANNSSREQTGGYTDATAKLMGLFKKSWGPTGASSCLFAGNTVFIRTWDNAPSWLGVTSRKKYGTSDDELVLTPLSEPMRIQVHASHNRDYCGPIFMGQRVQLTGAPGSIEVELRIAHHALGPALLEEPFCLEEVLGDGQVRAHDVLLQSDHALPLGSWDKWLTSLAVPERAVSCKKTFPGRFLSRVKEEVEQPWIVALLDSYVEAHAKQYEAKLWRLTQQHLQEIACARLKTLLSLPKDDNDIEMPVASLRSCYVSNDQVAGRWAQRVKLGWDKEDVSSRRSQWDMLELSPLDDGVGSSARNPLVPVTSRLLKTESVLEHPFAEMELMQWYLLRNKPLMFFRSKSDLSVLVFLGQKKLAMQELRSSVDMLAFDEASKSLAVLDSKEDTIHIYHFDALRSLKDTGVTAHLKDVGGLEVNWMGLTPDGERLLIADKYSVSAFAIGQQGKVYPRFIELQSPFSGKACVSPDGACLLVLSTAPAVSAVLQPGAVPAVAPPQAPECTSAAEAESSEGLVEPAGMALAASKDNATSQTDEGGARCRTCGATIMEPTAQGAAPVGQAGGDVSVGGGKCGADASLQVDVYVLERMEHLVSVPLDELRGTPEEWEMGCVTFGAQPNLVLFHRATARLESRILDVSVRA